MSKVLIDLMIEGHGDDEIMDQFGLEESDYQALKLQALSAKAQEYKQRPAEHVYVEYAIESARSLRMLNKAIKAMEASSDPKVMSALVSAVRTRKEICESMISQGIKLGVIEDKKTDPNAMMLGGLVFAELRSEDLRALAQKELRDLKALVGETNKPIEAIEVGDIFYGPRGDENARITLADDDDDD